MKLMNLQYTFVCVCVFLATYLHYICIHIAINSYICVYILYIPLGPEFCFP